MADHPKAVEEVHLGPPITWIASSLNTPSPSKSHPSPSPTDTGEDADTTSAHRQTSATLDVPSAFGTTSKHRRLRSTSIKPPPRVTSLPSPSETPMIEAIELNNISPKVHWKGKTDINPDMEHSFHSLQDQGNELLNLPPPPTCHLRVDDLVVGIPNQGKGNLSVIRCDSQARVG